MRVVYNHKQMGKRQTQTFEVTRQRVEPLAEHLQPELASAAVRLYETRTEPIGHLKSAWSHVEYGMIEGMRDAEVMNEFFGTSQMLISWLMRRDGVHHDIKLAALTLSTYIPLFKKRATEEVITDVDCENIYKSLGAAMAHLRPLKINEPPQNAMAEVSVLALSARTRQPWLLLFPTSPREEHSDIQTINHDSYFYEQSAKYPIQQKLLPTEKAYDEMITVLTLQPIVDKALRASSQNIEDTISEKINYLLSLIIAETSGDTLTREEARFLNYMSEAVAAHHYRLARSNDEAAAA